MSASKVLKHGEHANPHYAPAIGQTQSWVGKSTDAERKGGEVSGIVTRYSKRERASTTPVAMGWIKANFGAAIEYTGSSQGMRGLSLIAGGLGFCMGTGFSAMFASGVYDWPIQSYLDLPLWFAPPVFLAFGLWIALWTIRLELFRPTDEPTIFDRAHRKVYRIFRETQPGFKGLFKRWPLRVCEYEWDLIDVEHTATLATTGS